jgi:hypothetical protein
LLIDVFYPLAGKQSGHPRSSKLIPGRQRVV